MGLADHHTAPEVYGPNNPMPNAFKFVRDNYTRSHRPILIHNNGAFYVWAEKLWTEATNDLIRAQLYQAFAGTEYPKPTKDGGTELVPFQPTRAKIDNLIDALKAVTHQHDPVAAPAWFPAADLSRQLPPHKIIACGNGLLQIPGRRLWPHTPDFFNTACVPFDYDPDAPFPQRWLTFLKELWGDDQEAVDCLQEVVGYLLSGDTSMQKIFLITGPRRSGKGTIGRVLKQLIGADHVVGSTLASLRSNFGMAPLINAAVTLISDARLPKGDNSIITERLLSISGEDTLPVDRKYRSEWNGKLPTRIVMLSNELPRLDDVSGALASRFIILTLTRSFYGQENRRLTEELCEELPGIFNWALDGLDRLDQRDRFTQPQSGLDALHDLEDVLSPVGAFLRDRCVIGPEQTVRADDLYKAWKEWCDDHGYEHVSTVQTFGRDLRAAVPTIGATRPRDAIGRRYRAYEGIGLA